MEAAALREKLHSLIDTSSEDKLMEFSAAVGVITCNCSVGKKLNKDILYK